MEILNGQITTVDFKDNYYSLLITAELSLSNGCGVTLGFTNTSTFKNLFKVCGIQSYNDIIGRCVRVKTSCGVVKEIGHIIKDEWYEYPSLKKIN